MIKGSSIAIVILLSQIQLKIFCGITLNSVKQIRQRREEISYFC